MNGVENGDEMRFGTRTRPKRMGIGEEEVRKND
jgi:hypothetical protein